MANNLKSIPIDESAALLSVDQHLLLSAEDAFAWENGVRGARKGTTYTILRPDFEQQRVFVPDQAPLADAEIIRQAALHWQFYKVQFSGFEARAVVGKDGNIHIYANADKIRLITAPRKEGQA